MRAAVLTLLSVLLIVDKPRSFVDSAALSLHPNSADDLQSAFKSASGLRPESQALDEDVRELHNLKPFTNNLISMQRSSSRVYSDVNGHKESHVEDKQEVSHNGQKVESYRVEADAKDVANSATPATHVHVEVEVPAQGVHRTFDSADKRKSMSPGPDQDENLVEGYRSYAGVQYSPLDMAEYVFWTGDEKGVTMAIEEFLQDGMMTREEAIAFLQDIKINLDYLQNHYAEERMQKQELAKERANQLQKALTLEKMTEAKLSGPSDLAEVRQQMRDNLRKKNAEVEEFSPSMSRMASLTDQDYQDLLERLRVADFLYTEYSLEEVIYQLAKVMFSQSLNRGTTEAQEALQKFTGFLEAEAENGRISRSLEKKVLDVLIASLTDTLSEHPELVGAARASLGDNIPDSLLVMNKDHKTGVDASKAGLNKHRFQNSKVGLSDAGPAMKKSVTPPKQHPNP